MFSGIDFTREITLSMRVRTLAAIMRKPHVGQAVRGIAISLSVDSPTIEDSELALALSALRVCAGLQAASLEVSMDPRAGGALLAVVLSVQTLCVGPCVAPADRAGSRSPSPASTRGPRATSRPRSWRVRGWSS